MRRHGQLMAFSDHKLDGSKNYRNLLQEHETESCRQKQGKMNSVANRRLRIFVTCEISQIAKIRNLGNSQEKFCSPRHWNTSNNTRPKIII